MPRNPETRSCRSKRRRSDRGSGSCYRNQRYQRNRRAIILLLTVIGLGNPGKTYENNRHNAGYKVVELLAAQLGARFKKPFLKLYRIARIQFSGHRLFLVKPLTFMNRSGIIIKDIIKRTKCSIDNLVIISDNLDLPPGTCRLKMKGSSGGQKGLISIIDALGTENFKRIYIGIGRPGESVSVMQHVLSDPLGDALSGINKSISIAAEGILLLLNESPEKVMAFINKKNEKQQFAFQTEDIKSP